MSLNLAPPRTMLPEMGPGDHGCLFFSTEDDRHRATLEFLTAGLDRRQRCVYVGNPADAERTRRGFAEAGVDIGLAERAGRVVITSDRPWLDGDRFSTERMLGFLQEGYDAALGDGFTALRAAGDVTWQVGPALDYHDIVYYEALLDVFFIGKRMIGLCEYARDRCPPEVLEGILGTHRLASMDQALCANTRYVPPDIHLEKDPVVRQARRVEWMTAQLRHLKEAEEENRRLHADLERRVADRTRELREAYADLESFSHTVSHDLRSPLQVIGGYASLLEDEAGAALPAPARGHVQRIKAGVDRVTGLLENLLRFFKDARAPLATATVDMTAVAREADAETGAGAVIANLPAARGDAILLRQVFVNLLANAHKFTRDTADPRIDVTGWLEGERAVFQVADNGRGFAPEAGEGLFGAFQRGQGVSAVPGVGLGLAIVRRILAKHGGDIRATGSPGAGAVFTFRLPRA